MKNLNQYMWDLLYLNKHSIITNLTDHNINYSQLNKSAIESLEETFLMYSKKKNWVYSTYIIHFKLNNNSKMRSEIKKRNIHIDFDKNLNNKNFDVSVIYDYNILNYICIPVNEEIKVFSKIPHNRLNLIDLMKISDDYIILDFLSSLYNKTDYGALYKINENIILRCDKNSIEDSFLNKDKTLIKRKLTPTELINLYLNKK